MPRRRLAALPAALLLALACRVPGDGYVGEEARTIDAPIDRLEVLDGFLVDVTLDPGRGEGADLVVRGDQNLLDTFTTELHGGTILSIGDQPIGETRPAALRSVHVVTRALVGLFAGEDSTLRAATLAGPRIDLRARDEATLEATVSAVADLRVDGLGEAVITLDGSADDLRITTRDAVRVDAGDLVARRVCVDLAGAGEVVVCATEALSGRITGSVILDLACEPAAVDLVDDAEGDPPEDEVCP